MTLNELYRYINGLFETTENESFHKESGITVDMNKEIKRIGYCVNLTVETVEEAIKRDVDLMITHHDAWDYIYGMKEECIKRLKANGISHYFNHLPLDDARFGTNERLARAIGLDEIEKSHVYEGFYCGRIGEYKEPIAFSELIHRMEKTMEEPVESWKFNDRKIKKVGIVCGGGSDTFLLKAAHEMNCDVYISGEKILYTIQYAQFVKMNLIIGSHTFIEVLGIEGLANQIEAGCKDIEMVKLEEEHIEQIAIMN